jgi:hypothetical protein
MHRRGLKRAEDQEIERALEQIECQQQKAAENSTADGTRRVGGRLAGGRRR